MTDGGFLKSGRSFLRVGSKEQEASYELAYFTWVGDLLILLE